MAPQTKENQMECSPLFQHQQYQKCELPLTRSTVSLETERIESEQVAVPVVCRYKNGWTAFGASVFIAIVGTLVSIALVGSYILSLVDAGPSARHRRNGTYKLLEIHQGETFFDYYEFFDGPDSHGSNGYITYVGIDRAKQIGIFNVTTEEGIDVYNKDNNNDEKRKKESFVYMGSSPSNNGGPRDSLRLEGKKLHNDGLFILDLRHLPTGCGAWPAFWLTNEQNWPKNGEIDIVEGVNYLNVSKTALHTNEMCSMFGHVPEWYKTGDWDLAAGIPDRFTGIPDNKTSKPADDCYNYAPHQWENQGCVAVNPTQGTLGAPLNDNGGGVFALEWDPNRSRIRTWAFSPHTDVPTNLELALKSAHDLADGTVDHKDVVVPDTDSWPLPYGYFAIGADTGCAAEHFRNMHLVINLAFCGTAAGNRYFTDCPIESNQYFTEDYDSMQSCNKYISENPNALQDAYWKIRGVYVYKRERI